MKGIPISQTWLGSAYSTVLSTLIKMKIVDYNEPDKDYMLDMLKETAENVNAGKVKNMIITYECLDGTVKTSRCSRSKVALIGLCQLTLHHICDEMVYDD